METTCTVSQLTAAEVQAMLTAGNTIQLIDVRSPLEFDSENIKGARNIPLDELAQRSREIKRDCTVVIICRSGNRATRAANLLNSYGMSTSVLAGGMLAWKNAGLPVIKGKQRLSLERQVQLTIGVLLLSSVAAGFTLDRGWFIVPAFIGAGLTFAGLTGNCGLAILLAKAPWNQLSSQSKDQKPTKPTCCS